MIERNKYLELFKLVELNLNLYEIIEDMDIGNIITTRTGWGKRTLTAIINQGLTNLLELLKEKDILKDSLNNHKEILNEFIDIKNYYYLTPEDIKDIESYIDDIVTKRVEMEDEN